MEFSALDRSIIPAPNFETTTPNTQELIKQNLMTPSEIESDTKEPGDAKGSKMEMMRKGADEMTLKESEDGVTLSLKETQPGQGKEKSSCAAKAAEACAACARRCTS
jgi:hypothetical protein